MGYKLLFCVPIIALLSTNITLLLTNNCWHCCRRLIFSKPGRRDLLATRQHPRPSRSSSFQASEAICGCLLVMSLDFYFVFFSSDNIFGRLFSCLGNEFTTCAKLSTFCHVFVTIYHLLWQVWQKGLYWVKLAWRDVKRLNFAYSADHTFPGSVNFQQSRYIQFTLNPTHNPKNTRQLSHLPCLSDFIDIVHFQISSPIYMDQPRSVSTYHARNFPRIGDQQGY